MGGAARPRRRPGGGSGGGRQAAAQRDPPMVTVDGSAYTTGALTYAQPPANLVEVDFANAQRFGGNAAATGIRGQTPSPGHVALNQAAADALHVRAGDEVPVAAYRQVR